MTENKVKRFLTAFLATTGILLIAIIRTEVFKTYVLSTPVGTPLLLFFAIFLLSVFFTVVYKITGD